MENVIDLKNVSKQFKGFSINNMDLQVKKGFITGFIGANGAGKTTTIKMMMNLLKPDAGEVKLFGLDYKTYEKEIKERIGFVYDGNVFFEGMNLKDIKRIVGPAYKRWDDALFYKYIDQFELPLNKAIKKFSKGMQMKASLALALSHHAELIIMDEPTAGLDPIFRREFLNLVQELMLDGNRTIFFSTHITTDLDRIADYIAFIQGGKLVFNQSIHEVAENYALVKGSVELLDRDTEKAFIHIHRAPTGFEALTNNIAEVEETFGNTVIIERASLEDVMYYLEGGSSMFSLMRRDLIIQKWQLLVFIPFILVFILTNSHPILTFLVSSFYIPFNAYYYDEKAETNILLNSLPYTRKEIIASRYLSAIVCMVLSIVLVSLFLFVFGKNFTLTHIAIGSGLFLLFASFAFPLFYLLKQGHIFTIVLISFLVSVAVIPSVVDFLMDYMPMITNFIASLSTITLYTGLALGVAILYALSWGISTIVYQRKAF